MHPRKILSLSPPISICANKTASAFCALPPLVKMIHASKFSPIAISFPTQPSIGNHIVIPPPDFKSPISFFCKRSKFRPLKMGFRFPDLLFLKHIYSIYIARKLQHKLIKTLSAITLKISRGFSQIYVINPCEIDRIYYRLSNSCESLRRRRGAIQCIRSSHSGNPH